MPELEKDREMGEVGEGARWFVDDGEETERGSCIIGSFCSVN